MFLFWYRFPRNTCYYRYNFFSGGFMKSLRLPFDNRSPFGFRICHPILTLCRYSVIVFICISLLLRFIIIIYSLIIFMCIYLLLNLRKSIGLQDKLSVFINDVYKIYNSVFPEANIVFISQGDEESGSNSEYSSSNNSSGNNPGNDPEDNGPNSDSNDNQPNHDDDKDNDPNDADDNDDDKSDATIKTLDTSDTHDVLLWTAALVEGGLEGDIDAIETAKEQFPDCFEGRSEREGLLKVSEVIEEDIKAYRDEQKAKQAFIDDDNQSESEESSNIEEKSESEETVDEELKRKREDESSNDEPESKRYKSKNNDDSDNDDSDNSGSSGLGGSGDNGNPLSENSRGSSENSKSWIDIGIFLLMFFSSIADSITLFFENLI